MIAQVEIEFDEAEHRYTVGGFDVPGVTTVLKRAGRIDDKFYTDEAAERGRRLHKATQIWDLSKDRENFALNERFAGDEINAITRWQAWLDATGAVVSHVECRLYDQELAVAGTMDRLLTMAKIEWVSDLKFGAPAPWHKLQVAGYARAAGVDRAVIVYFGDGFFPRVEVIAPEAMKAAKAEWATLARRFKNGHFASRGA